MIVEKTLTTTKKQQQKRNMKKKIIIKINKKTEITETQEYVIQRKFCGSSILRIGDFLWFEGTNFCGSR